MARKWTLILARLFVSHYGTLASFQQQDYMHMQFPAQMYIDYVRVYQREDSPNMGCDPSSHPTADYITAYVTLCVRDVPS